MKVVEISCARAINLTGISENNEEDTKLLQTVNIYDLVTISHEELEYSGIFIKSRPELSYEFKEKIRTLIIKFLNYTNLKIGRLSIEIEKDQTDLLESDGNILAGIITGLDCYFKTGLDINELGLIANQIDQSILYYLVGGYKRVNSDRFDDAGENIYNKYIILQLEDKITEQKLMAMKEFIKNQENISYRSNKSDEENFYFIALKDTISPSIPISLKKNFGGKTMFICDNSPNQKVLIKYL